MKIINHDSITSFFVRWDSSVRATQFLLYVLLPRLPFLKTRNFQLDKPAKFETSQVSGYYGQGVFLAWCISFVSLLAKASRERSRLAIAEEDATGRPRTHVPNIDAEVVPIMAYPVLGYAVGISCRIRPEGNHAVYAASLYPLAASMGLLRGYNIGQRSLVYSAFRFLVLMGSGFIGQGFGNSSAVVFIAFSSLWFYYVLGLLASTWDFAEHKMRLLSDIAIYVPTMVYMGVLRDTSYRYSVLPQSSAKLSDLDQAAALGTVLLRTIYEWRHELSTVVAKSTQAGGTAIRHHCPALWKLLATTKELSRLLPNPIAFLLRFGSIIYLENTVSRISQQFRRRYRASEPPAEPELNIEPR